MGKQDIDDGAIATAAYLKWLDEGMPEGRDAEHWASARAELEAAAPKPRKAAKTRAKPKATKAAEKKKTPAARKPRAKKPAG